MSNKSPYTWDANKLVDDVEFEEDDRAMFEKYLSSRPTKPEEDKLAVLPGKILTGKIVEITKDHVIVDVGLKSEGMVPISEFSDPSVLVLDGDVEVYLYQSEDAQGQIVLSREKAERLRQW